MENVRPEAELDKFSAQAGILGDKQGGIGQHTLSAVPYAGRDATGTRGAALTVTFSIIE